jgi:hypothetical protein
MRARTSCAVLAASIFAMLAVVATCATATPAPAKPGTNPASTWSVVRSPSRPGVGQRLTSVDSISSTDAWAVGDVYDQARGDQLTMTQHWDGVAWRVAASPSPSAFYNTLTSVSAAGADDVWAAGYTIDEAYEWGPLLEHRAGGGWRVVDGAPLDPEYGALYGIAAIAPDDVWAVGFQGNPFFTTLTEHWDGSRWSKVPSPSPGVYAALYAVSANGPDDVWSVGYQRTGDRYLTVTLHWDGASWSQVTSPNPSSISFMKGVVAAGPDLAWAVGYSESMGSSRPFVERWDGSSWTIVSSPSIVAEYSELDSVAATSATHAAAVGWHDDGSGDSSPIVEEWDGSKWTQVTAPEPAGFEGLSYGVGVDEAGGYWAVGYSYRDAPQSFRTYVLRSTG